MSDTMTLGKRRTVRFASELARHSSGGAAPVPEPGPMALVALGGTSHRLFRRKK